jgi:hypothetical protein
MADGIVRAGEELAARRADLNALARLLTSEGRRLNGPATSPLPGQISRALHPADPVLNGAAAASLRPTGRLDTPLCANGLLSDTAGAAKLMSPFSVPGPCACSCPAPAGKGQSLVESSHGGHAIAWGGARYQIFGRHYQAATPIPCHFRRSL